MSIIVAFYKDVQYNVIVDAEDFENYNGKLHINNGNYGYKVVKTVNNEVFARELLEITDSNIIVDHIDKNPLNNQKSNLRLLNRTTNRYNNKFDITKYRYVIDKPNNEQFYVKIPALNVSKAFDDNHSAIKFAYPLVQKLQGEFCSDKRDLYTVLRDVPFKRYNRKFKVGRTTKCECGVVLSNTSKLRRHKNDNCSFRKSLGKIFTKHLENINK